MEEERVDYIILDSKAMLDTTNGSSWDDTTKIGKWLIPRYFFSKYIHGDEIYIELINSTFTAGVTESGNIPTSLTSTIYVSGINIYNQYITDTQTVLGVVPCGIVLAAGTYFISPSGLRTYVMKLRTDIFNTISLSVGYEVEPVLDIDVLNMPYRFILKVTYKKKN